MYKEIYNIMGSEAPGLSLPLSLAISVIFLVFLYFKIRNRNKLLKIFPLFAVVVILAVTINRLYSTGDYRNLKGVITTKEFTRVEGEVTSFTPLNEMGLESLTVDGLTFTYGNTPLNPAFNRSNYTGEVFKVGQTVRIFYYNDRILAIWVLV